MPPEAMISIPRAGKPGGRQPPDGRGGRDAPVPQVASELARRARRAVRLDGGPRRAAAARDVDRGDARGGDPRRDRRGDPAPGLLDHHRPPELAGDALDGLERAAEVAIAARLRQLLRRIEVDAQRVGLDARHRLADRGRGHLPELDHAEVREQVDLGRAPAHFVGVGQLGVLQHRALAAQAEGDAVPLGGGGERAVDLGGLVGAAGHAGDHERRADRPPQELGADVDLGERQLRQRAVNQVDVGEQRRAMEVRVSRCGDREMVRLTLCDLRVRHGI